LKRGSLQVVLDGRDDEGTRGFRVDAAALADAVRIANALRRKPDSRPRASTGSSPSGRGGSGGKCHAER